MQTMGLRGLKDKAYDAALRPGSSAPRLREFVAMMVRHPTLTVTVDGHESDFDHTLSGHSTKSQARACFISGLIHDGEDGHSIEATRIQFRGWGNAVVSAAGWGNGALGSNHAELFFSLDGVEIPTRGVHYSQTGPRPSPRAFQPILTMSPF